MGGIAITGATLLAWYGTAVLKAGASKWVLCGYWGVFLCLLVFSLYIVVLDIRFIRLQYLLSQRDNFEKTIGSEDFRTALRELQQQRKQSTPREEE